MSNYKALSANINRGIVVEQNSIKCTVNDEARGIKKQLKYLNGGGINKLMSN